MSLIFCGFLFTAMFFPHLGHARAEYPFVLLLLFAAVTGRAGGPVLRGVRVEILLLGLMAISGLISIVAYNTTKASAVFHWRDLMSIVRYPAYMMMILAGSSLRIDERAKSTIYGYIGVAALLASAVSIVQYFNVFGLNQIFLATYRDASDEVYVNNFVLDAGFRRIIGTAGNPNNWGFALSLLGLLTLSRVVYSRHLSWIPHLSLIFLSLLMTGSRSTLIGFLAGGLVIFGVGMRLGRARGATIATAGLAVVLIPLVFTVYTQRLQTERGADRFSTERIGSLFNRFDVWTATLREYAPDLWVGRGPAKATRRVGFASADTFHVRDNIFVSVFAQFGVLGLSLLLGFFYLQWTRLYAGVKRAPPGDLAWPLGMLGGFVSWTVYNTTADALFALHPTHTFLALYGVTIAWIRATAGSRATSKAAAAQPERQPGQHRGSPVASAP